MPELDAIKKQTLAVSYFGEITDTAARLLRAEQMDRRQAIRAAKKFARAERNKLQKP